MKQIADRMNEFFVQAEIYKEDKTNNVTVKGSYPEYGFAPVTCEIVPHGGKFDHDLWIMEGNFNFLQLRTKTGSSQDIWIPRLRQGTHTTNNLGQIFTGTAELFVRGNLKEFEEPADVDVYLTIPETQLIPEPFPIYDSENGTIQVPENYERSPISWKAEDGETVHFLPSYSFNPLNVEGNIGLLRLRNCQLVVKYPAGRFNSLKSVSEHIWKLFDEDIWLLSFINKKYLPWFKASLYTNVKDEFLHAEIRRHQVFQERLEADANTKENYSLTRWPLAKYEALAQGTFESMIEEFRQSPYRSTLLQIIQTLMVTYEKNYIEAELSLAYTAFEMLIQTLGRDYAAILDEEEFEKIKNSLKGYIKSNLKLEKTIRSLMYEKLPELQRVSFKQLVKSAIKAQGIDLSKFWGPEVSEDKLDQELSQMISRRNAFIHGDVVNGYDLYFVDFHRIRLIIELTVLKLLGYPLNQLNHANSELLYIMQRHLPENYSFELP